MFLTLFSENFLHVDKVQNCRAACQPLESKLSSSFWWRTIACRDFTILVEMNSLENV